MSTPVGTFTLQTVTDRILSRLPEGDGNVGIVAPNSPLRVKILNEVNLQVAEMYKKISSDDIEKYYVETDIAFTNNVFNMRSISDFEQFIELREVSYGSVPKSSTMRLETLFNSIYYVDCFACATYGDNLKLFVGSELSTTGRTFKLKYLRLPIRLVAPTELVDLPDNWIEKLIEAVLSALSSANTKKK